MAMGFKIAEAAAKTEAMLSKNRARKHRRVAASLERARQRRIRARQARETLRQGIIARSEALAAGVQQGAQGSSALTGALGSISSQIGENIQFQTQMEQFNRVAQNRLNKAARHETMAEFHQFNAEMFGSVSESMGGSGGGFGGFGGGQ